MGSKTNIPAPDLISEARSQSVTCLNSSTSQVRGRERGGGQDNYLLSLPRLELSG